MCYIIIFKKSDTIRLIMEEALLRQLQSAQQSHWGQRTVTNSGVNSMQQRSIPKCPGLNRVSTNNYHWTVPNGTTASKATYCENCTKKFRIAGNQHRTLSGCNCDSYRLSNKANNGIFNISFWEPSLFSLYETLLAEDSTYYVKIPSGKKFSVL